MHLCWNVPLRMTFARVLAASTIAALAVACGGTTTTVSEVAGPDAVRCQTSVSTTPPTVPYGGSRITLAVAADRDCTWTAGSDSPWAQVSPASGQGQASLSVTVLANTDTNTRSAGITVNDVRVSVMQEAMPCRFQLASSQGQMSYDGGRTSVSMSTSSACAWRASSNAAWARVLTDSGTGSNSVDLEVAANTGAERTATISIGDQSFVLVQQGRPSDAPPPGGGPGCSVAIDPSDRSFNASGGDGTIRVTAPSGCAWSATTGASWIELSGSNGTGNDTVRYKVQTNTSTSVRTGTISVAGRPHSVRQDAAVSAGGGGGEQKVDLSGRAWLLSGSCPSISFVLEGRAVFTTGDTKFRDGNCGDVRWGTELNVEGRLQSDGRVRATDVRIRRD